MNKKIVISMFPSCVIMTKLRFDEIKKCAYQSLFTITEKYHRRHRCNKNIRQQNMLTSLDKWNRISNFHQIAKIHC